MRRQSLTYYVEFVAINDNAQVCKYFFCVCEFNISSVSLYIYTQYIAFGASVAATVQRTLTIANGMNNVSCF